MGKERRERKECEGELVRLMISEDLRNLSLEELEEVEEGRDLVRSIHSSEEEEDLRRTLWRGMEREGNPNLHLTPALPDNSHSHLEEVHLFESLPPLLERKRQGRAERRPLREMDLKNCFLSRPPFRPLLHNQALPPLSLPRLLLLLLLQLPLLSCRLDRIPFSDNLAPSTGTILTYRPQTNSHYSSVDPIPPRRFLTFLPSLLKFLPSLLPPLLKFSPSLVTSLLEFLLLLLNLQSPVLIAFHP